jgi:hypothetical protein
MEALRSTAVGPIQRVTTAPGNFEPHITVDPTDPNHLAAIVIGTSKFDCRWRPRGLCDINLYLHESHDGGRHWEAVRLTGSMGFDGQVAFAADGTLYAVGMDNSAIFLHKRAPHDGAAPPKHTLVEPPGANDKPWLTIAPAGDALYLTYSRGKDLVVRRSSDAGETWSEAVVAVEGPELVKDGVQTETPPWGGQVLVARHDELAVTWLHSEQRRGAKYLEWRAWVAISADAGRTFSAPHPIADTRGALSAASHDGVYYAFYRAGTRERQELVVSISQDGGRTWPRHVVSGDMPLYQGLVPAPGVGVAPNGTFDVVFYNPATPHCFDLDARNRVYLERAASEWVDTCRYNVFYCSSHDHGITWSQPLRLNEAPIAGQDFVRMQGFSRPGEYIGMASTDQHAHPIWIEGVHAYMRRLTR